eukprot:m.25125 g.25125  ORF g.25125 m.25125 type:complete len:515 (+) comp13517_c0_seq1:3-1547(+)
MMFLTVWIVASIFAVSDANSIKLCQFTCPSTKITYSKCIDTFGSASSGECPVPTALQWGNTNEFTAFPDVDYTNVCPDLTQWSCPNSAPNCNLVFGENVFDSPKACWTAFQNFMTADNPPVVVTSQLEAPSSSSRRRRTTDLSLALHEQDDLQKLTPQERTWLEQELQLLMQEHSDPAVRVTREDAAMALEPVSSVMQAHVRLRRETEGGVYTNSKCAACAFFVDEVLSKFDDKFGEAVTKVCEAVVKVVLNLLCTATGPFKFFCNLVVDIAEQVLLPLGTALCETIVGALTNGLRESIKDGANDYICSKLTCGDNELGQQAACETNKGSPVNIRCSEFLNAAALFQRGLCIVDNVIKAVDTVNNVIKDPSQTVLDDLSDGDIDLLDDADITKVRNRCITSTGSSATCPDDVFEEATASCNATDFEVAIADSPKKLCKIQDEKYGDCVCGKLQSGCSLSLDQLKRYVTVPSSFVWSDTCTESPPSESALCNSATTLLPPMVGLLILICATALLV